MRRTVILAAAAVLLSSAGALAAPVSKTAVFKVGAAKVDITPATDQLPKGVDGIHDHIFARAITVQNGTTRAALVTVDLAAVTPPFPPTILGLYRGPVGHAAELPAAPGDEPVSIVLYRKNLARAVKSRTELSEQIRDTLLHEIGHLEGLDEDDLRRRGME